jgi:hypothetical protein
MESPWAAPDLPIELPFVACRSRCGRNLVFDSDSCVDGILCFESIPDASGCAEKMEKHPFWGRDVQVVQDLQRVVELMADRPDQSLSISPRAD